ncbi:MAG TPA: plasmid pRiA4b ORF-3 family protein [Gammaproteobacteria bacterium]|nr:plasmid pRiA4b ORF-3 family protein [Gammaproteobacteria bacterium]
MASQDKSGKHGSRTNRPVRPETPSEVLELRVQLQYIEPPVWRRLRIRSSATLADLHDAIQAAMGWSDSHLHEFFISGRRYGPLHEDAPEELIDEAKIVLASLGLKPATRFTYNYDFGDNWAHDIRVEKIEAMAAELLRSLCLNGARACPPEDCGGPPGYQELLAALANPRHPRHRELRRWVGKDWDAERFDLEAANRALRSRSPGK